MGLFEWLRRSQVPDIPEPDPAEVARIAAELERWTLGRRERLLRQMIADLSGLAQTADDTPGEEE